MTRGTFVVDLLNQTGTDGDGDATARLVLDARRCALDAAVRHAIAQATMPVPGPVASVTSAAAQFERWLLRPHRAQPADDVETDRA